MVNCHFPTVLCTYLCCSIIFLKLSLGSDTLYPDQTLVFGQTLISRNQVFVTGFVPLGATRNGYYVGTWYKNTPDIVIWVANRNDPITDPQGVVLTMAGNGTLVVRTTRGNRVVWSSNSSAEATNPVLQLLGTGNLVIVDKTSQSSSTSSDSYLWQSFDYPENTRLTGTEVVEGMNLTSWKSNDDPSPGDYVFKIENRELSEVVILRGESKTCRTGPWNGVYLGSPTSPSATIIPQLGFNEGRLVSILVPYDRSSVARITLEYSGSAYMYSMNGRRDRWNVVSMMPRDPCDYYGQCGPNGICRIEKAVMCECFKGFSPKFSDEWETVQDWSGGCARNRALNCEGGDDFQEIRGIKVPDLLQFRLNTSMNLGECRDECLRNCSCTAYANPYINNGGSGCLMWFGDLIDTRELPGTDANQTIYIRLANSEFDSGTKLTAMAKKTPNKLVIIILTSTGVPILGLICGLMFLRIRRKTKEAKRNNEDLELPLFKFATIAAATNNFSSENMVGEGGFGPVYRGTLSAEEEIAVKRLSKTSRQGLEEFKNEVSLIAKLQHRNLVRLLGCCIEGEERMLVYEFLQNKSLDYFVFDKTRRAVLTWPKRFEIIMGISRGLLYLHQDSRLKIIHRDLKTGNILLDQDLNPKISDFGLARIFSVNETIARTKRVVGTYGYMAPEYAIDGKFSIKSDIYSLGVVLLEIVSGKKNRSFMPDDHHHSLLGHAWLLWNANKVMELMDKCLNDSFIESQVKRCIQVGLLCVQKFAECRPVMSSVLFMLGAEGVVLPEPQEPGFFTERSSDCCGKSCSGHDTITISELVAR